MPRSRRAKSRSGLEEKASRKSAVREYARSAHPAPGDAGNFAEHLSRRGHQAISTPLLSVRFHDSEPLKLDGVQGILVTSANGIRALARLSERRDLPVFAVGPQTAREALAVASRASKVRTAMPQRWRRRCRAGPRRRRARCCTRQARKARAGWRRPSTRAKPTASASRAVCGPDREDRQIAPVAQSPPARDAIGAG